MSWLASVHRVLAYENASLHYSAERDHLYRKISYSPRANGINK